MRKIGGVLIPEIGGDSSQDLSDYILKNADPKILRMMKKRNLMMMKNEEEVSERINLDQQGFAPGET